MCSGMILQQISKNTMVDENKKYGTMAKQY